MSNRRTPQPTDRIIRALRLDTPVNLGGRAVADSALSRTRANARARAGYASPPSGILARQHHRDVLKLAGVAPQTTYLLTYAPVDQPHWPALYVDGLSQPPSTGWSISSRILSVPSSYGLLAGHTLHVEYDYGRQATIAALANFAQSTSSPASSTSVTVPIPPATIPGDLLLACVGRSGTWTTPAGWTLLGALSAAPGLSTGQGPHTFNVYYRVADGSETPVAFASSVSHERAGIMVAVKGVDPLNPIGDWESSSVVGTTTPYTPPTVTVGPENRRIVYFVARDGEGTTEDDITVPAGVTLITNHALNSGQFSQVAASEIANEGVSVSRTFTDPGAVIATNAFWGGFTISLRTPL